MEDFLLGHSNTLIYKQKQGFMRHYYVYDEKNQLIGEVKEEKNFSRLIHNTLVTLMGLFPFAPYELKYFDTQGEIQFIVKRSGGIKGKVEILLPSGEVMVTYVQKVMSLKPKLFITGLQGELIGEVNGSLLGGQFAVVNNQQVEIASVNKALIPDSLKDMFAKGDIYQIKTQSDTDKLLKLKLVSLPIIIDTLWHDE